MKTSRAMLNFLLILLTTNLACSLTPAALPEDASPPPPAASAEPFFVVANSGTITLLTAETGVGVKPHFQWQAVEKADRYQIILFDSSGMPYWAWEGAATEIYLGGTQAAPPDDAEGPILSSNSSWVVYAFDTEGQFLAVSARQAISP